MIGFNEAALLQWLLPLLWPFLRVLALLWSAPVLSSRAVPVRVKVGMALLLSVAAQASLPPMPVLPLDSITALAMVAQQILIGVTLGFAARVVFASVEFAGELVGLQMGLNFAGFFDPATGSQGTGPRRTGPVVRARGARGDGIRGPPAAGDGRASQLRILSGF